LPHSYTCLNMNDNQFWSLIERSRADVRHCDEQAAKLTALLDELETLEVVGFWHCWDANLGALYRWDVWAVAYIINGGFSDDGFLYFCNWVPAQGREFFQAVLDKPERAAERVQEGAEGEEVECEDIMYCAATIYKNRTGKYPQEDYPAAGSEVAHHDPMGERWREEDLPRLYPELCALRWRGRLSRQS